VVPYSLYRQVSSMLRESVEDMGGSIPAETLRNVILNHLKKQREQSRRTAADLTMAEAPHQGGA